MLTTTHTGRAGEMSDCNYKFISKAVDMNSYYERNKKKILKRMREWRNKNRDKIREHNKRYYKKNRKAVRDSQRKYFLRNKEKELKRIQEWARKNPEKRNANSKKYRLANREKYVAWLHNRRDKLKKAGKISIKALSALRAKTKSCCYCNRRRPLQIEHKVPIARGGTNHISNIALACGTCNRRKHTKTHREFKLVYNP